MKISPKEGGCIMDIFKKRVKRYVPETTTRSNANDEIKRIQFNTFIDPMTKRAMRFLAVVYEVPIYAVVEHACQIGGLYMIKARQDPKEKERLQQHLVSRHILGKQDARETDFLAASKSIFSSILLSDIVDLYKEFKKLDYLAFKADDMPDREWGIQTATTRFNMRAMFTRLIVKVDQLCVKDDDEHPTRTDDGTGLACEDATAEEDFTTESGSDVL